RGEKDLTLRLDATFYVGTVGPRPRRLPSVAAADASVFADDLHALQQRMIAFGRKAPDILKVPPTTANLAVRMWQSLKIETEENRVRAEMRMEPKSLKALVDGVRALLLSSFSSLLRMLEKLLQPEKQEEGRGADRSLKKDR